MMYTAISGFKAHLAPATRELGRSAAEGSGGEMISTRDLSLLPDVDGLRHLLQSLAMLDAVLSPDWQYRYYSFNAGWSTGSQMGSMRNSSGDDFYTHFSSAGCWLKGFAHESPMSPYREQSQRQWPGVLDAVPAEFAECLREPAFEAETATFCIWRRYADTCWQVGPVEFPTDPPDPDGSADLLSILDGRPESYQSFAADYYEREVELAAIEHVYAHRPLTRAVVVQLNPEATLQGLAEDIREIGYPRETKHTESDSAADGGRDCSAARDGSGGERSGGNDCSLNSARNKP